MALSWRDMSTPLGDNAPPASSAPAASPPPAPSAAPSSGASWRDMSTPLAAPSTATAAAPAPASAAAPGDIAQPGDTLGNMAWTDPRAANASTKDFMLAHLSELGKGLGQIGGTAADYARVAANTYGVGDSTLASLKALYGDVTGNARNPNSIANVINQQATGQNNANDYLSNLTAAKAATAAASDRLGTAGNLAANMTGGGPLGDVASSVGGMAAPYVGKWAGGVLGSAATGGGSTAAGELGRNETVSPWDIGVGTVLGAAGGAPGGVVGRGGTLPAGVSEDALRAAAKTAYAPLDSIVFHGPTQVKPALDAVTNTMTDAEQDLAKSTMAKVNKLGGVTNANGTVSGGVGLATGSDLQSYQKIFSDLAQSGSAEDRQFAPKFKTALEGVMQNTTPIGLNVTPGQGMSLLTPGMLGAPGPAAGEAAAARDAGNIPFQRAQDVGRLNDWQAKSNVAGGPDVGAQASSFLTSDAGQQFAAPGTPQYDALNTLAKTAQAPLTNPDGGITMWDIKHHLLWPAVGLAGAQTLGAYGSAEGHQPWWASIPEDVGGVVAGMVLKNRLAAAGAKAQQQAIAAARTALSTGQAASPVLPGAPLRDTMRRVFFGQTAAGQAPGQSQ